MCRGELVRAGCGSLALLLGCASTDAWTPPSHGGVPSSMADYAVVQTEFCQDLPWTESCVEERRHLEAREDRRKLQVAVEHASREQAAAAREASGVAMAGDGLHHGQGWWCFEGHASGTAFGRCARSLDRCVERLDRAIEKGLQPTRPQCRQQQKAACFSLTRALAEGARSFCFPSTEMCDHYRAVAEEHGTSTDCRAYD